MSHSPSNMGRLGRIFGSSRDFAGPSAAVEPSPSRYVDVGDIVIDATGSVSRGGEGPEAFSHSGDCRRLTPDKPHIARTFGGRVEQGYDVFVSYSWADRAAVEALVQALRDSGLRAFLDDSEIDDFKRITTTITHGLAASKVMLAYYSAGYPNSAGLPVGADRRLPRHPARRRPQPADPSRGPRTISGPRTSWRSYATLWLPTPPPRATSSSLRCWPRRSPSMCRRCWDRWGGVAPLAPPRWLPVQGLGSTRFVGRLREMWQLHSTLHPDTTRLTVGHTGPAVAQVRGLGGVGKSLLAEEYALRFGAAYPGGVYWLRAYGSQNQTDLPARELDARRHDELRELARGLALAVDGRDPEELPGLLADAIEERGQPCLWVVDDLPKGLDPRQIGEWLAPHPLACTLLTTRSQTYGAQARAIEHRCTRRPRRRTNCSSPVGHPRTRPNPRPPWELSKLSVAMPLPWT